jgi:hypothetical protein
MFAAVIIQARVSSVVWNGSSVSISLTACVF